MSKNNYGNRTVGVEKEAKTVDVVHNKDVAKSPVMDMEGIE